MYLGGPVAPNCTIKKIKSSPIPWIGLVHFELKIAYGLNYYSRKGEDFIDIYLKRLEEQKVLEEQIKRLEATVNR